MALNVATYEQILTILTQLATNYTNLFDVYYRMFYSQTPEDLVIQLYDEAGNLNAIEVPNRAKDRLYILNGNGDPNNITSGNKGSIYQDLTNGDFYLNINGTIDGWTRIVTRTDLNEIIIQGGTNPEGVITSTRGTLYSDTQNGILYIKTTQGGNTGWINVSADLENIVNEDLSNLSPLGEAHFANPSLTNLSSQGVALFTAKEDIVNKLDAIVEDPSLLRYPTVNAVYNALQNKQNTLYSGTNIKTINGNSILGSGNISIQTSSTTGFTKQINITGAVSGSATMNTGNSDTVNISTTLNSSGFANTSLTNLTSGLSNVICTSTPSTYTTASNSKPAVVVQNYRNGASWYRVWSDGWCEQGGIVDNGSATNAYHIDVTFLRSFSNTNYSAHATPVTTTTASATASIVNKSASGMTINVNRTYQSGAYSQYTSWFVCGYLS